MIQKPFRGMQLNRTHPLAKGLVGCWLFNEATGETAFDLSGNGNNGTLENGVTWGNDGLEFDGVDGYVNFGGVDFSGGFSITVLIKFDDDTADLGIVGQGTSSIDRIFKVWRDEYVSGDRIGFVVWNEEDSTGTIGYGATVLDTTSLYIITVTYDGLVGCIYLNGVDDTYIQLNNSIKSGIPPFRIGTQEVLGSYLGGTIDSICHHNRVLSAEEVAWLYREPYAMFEPAFNPALLYSAAPPVGAIMNQFQKANIGADLYNGVLI